MVVRLELSAKDGNKISSIKKTDKGKQAHERKCNRKNDPERKI